MVGKIVKKISLVNLAAVLQLVFGLTFVLSPITASAAGNATFSLSPASGSFTKGSTLSVVIKEDSGGEEVNTVEADINYDTSKLEFINIDNSGSAFTMTLIEGASGSVVQIIRGIAGGGVTGSQKVSTVNFRVLADSGSTSLTFASSSSITKKLDQSELWNGNNAGGTYTLTVASTPTTPSTSSPSGSGGGGSQTQTTAAPAQSTTTPQPNIADDQPVPASTQVSDSGYKVAIIVVDSNGIAREGIEVTLNDIKQKTDANGVASFYDIPAGNYKASVLGAEQDIVIANGDINLVQSFTVTSDASSSTLFDNIIKYAGIILLVVVFLVVGLTLIRHFKNRSDSDPYANKNHGTYSYTNLNPSENTPNQVNKPTPSRIIEPRDIE